jgi:deoxyribodipyrimidine photolyase
MIHTAHTHFIVIWNTGLNPYRHIPMYDPLKQSRMHDKDATFIKAMIPCLKDVSVPEVFEPWKMNKNPYINVIIDIDKVYQQNKALLYERKSKTKKEHT